MTHYPCRLRNATTRPVEIHRGGAVLVLDPGGFVEIESGEPGLEALERSGVLTRHALPSAPKARPAKPKPKSAEPEPAPAAEKSRRGKAGRARRGSTPKRPAAEDSGELP